MPETLEKESPDRGVRRVCVCVCACMYLCVCVCIPTHVDHAWISVFSLTVPC